jgi:SAM-dependent methyltransferase
MTSNPIEAYYDQESFHEWERFDRHPTEFAVTRRMIQETLPPAPARILDIGGGPGRYAIWLAGQGYSVTLLDLSKQNLMLATEKSAEAGVAFEAMAHGNALDLSAYPDESFDAVLLMGPLYHLVKQEDRLRAIHEARRVLKTGGRFYAAFICRFSVFRAAAHDFPMEPVELPGIYEQILSDGIYSGAHGFTAAYFAHPDEIQPMMESCGLHTMEIIGVEGVVSEIEEGVKALSGPAWDRWVDMNYRLGKDKSLHGASDHILYVGEK